MTSGEINRRRFWYGLVGFVTGFAGAILIGWLLGDGFAAVEAFEAGTACAAGLLAYAEKRNGLPTRDEASIICLREEMSPLDLKGLNQVPSTLKTEKERQLPRQLEL